MKEKLLIVLCLAFFAYSPRAQDDKVINPVIVVQAPSEEELYPVEPGICDILNGMFWSADIDRDGIENCNDNCLFDRNKDQKDKDKDGIGDACESRKKADDEWEHRGQRERRTATEPVDLKELVRSSTNILLVRFKRIGDRGKHVLEMYMQVEVLREFKGKAHRIPISVYRGIWVRIPDDGPRELIGDFDLLLFLKDGKVRRWTRPHTWSAEIVNGKPRTETHYFGYELADKKYGVLGVSDRRLEELSQLIQRDRSR